jgi:hypothetical protein
VIGLIVWGAGMGATAACLDRQLVEVRQDLDEAVRARHAAERALIVLADEHAAALQRKTTAQTGKEAIRALPEGEDGAISPTLRMGLETADRLGGHE